MDPKLEKLATVDRWPPTYDAEQLAQQIRELAGSPDIARGFYDNASGAHRVDLPEFCQGDIVHLDCKIPLIGPDGGPVAMDANAVWMVIGNTCDLARTSESVPFTQVVPAIDVGSQSAPPRELSALRRYSQYRSFYLPPWRGSDRHYVANFLQPVPLHKGALPKVRRLARLTVRSWVLLHSCLVRFLARDDGRHDPD